MPGIFIERRVIRCDNQQHNDKCFDCESRTTGEVEVDDNAGHALTILYLEDAMPECFVPDIGEATD
jgi:hypothetical protein